MQTRVAAAAKKKTRTIEAGEGVVGGRAAALPKKTYPLGHLKPLFNVEEEVYAAWWDGGVLAKDRRGATASWFPGRVSSYKEIDTDSPYGPFRFYDVTFDDGDESNEIEEYWVFSRDDYLLSVTNYGVSSWIGVRSETDPRAAEDDKWPSIVGWYVATIDGKDQSYPRLSEALDAYDTFVIQRKGKDVLPTDLNRPDKFICFVEQSNSEKCVDDDYSGYTKTRKRRSPRSGNESRPRSPPKLPGAGPSHRKNKNEESTSSSEKHDKTPSSDYKGISNSERDRKYQAHAGAAAMAPARCSTPPAKATTAARRGRRGTAAATPSPAGKVIDLTGDDRDDENDAAATPGGVDRGTTGGCGSDRRSGQSFDPSEVESGRIVENGDEDDIVGNEGGGGKGSKERGHVKRKEEEASRKEAAAVALPSRPRRSAKKRVAYFSKRDSEMEDSDEGAKPKKRARRRVVASADKGGKGDARMSIGSDSGEFELGPGSDEDDESIATVFNEADNDEVGDKPNIRASARSKGSPPSRRGKSIGAVARLGARSVAARGLPEGSLARGLGGFEIRALERVSRLDDTGVGRPSDPLPCRLLVVSAGTGVDGVGRAMCPAHLVDQTFEGGAELHAHTLGDICTYEMTAAIDESWTGWDSMRCRLLASGVVVASPSSGDARVSEDVEAVVTAIACIDEDDAPAATTHRLTRAVLDAAADRPDLRWALIEGRSRDAAVVIVSAPAWLVAPAPPPLSRDPVADPVASRDVDGEDDGDFRRDKSGLLPRLSNEACGIRLPASLLQKAIRRRAGLLCSAAPLLEACRELVLPGGARGSSSAFLRTLCGSMLAEAMPAATSLDALGIDALLALWLVSLANPEWELPPILARRAVAAALRAQARDANQWVGFMRQARMAEDASSLHHIEPEEQDTEAPTGCRPEGMNEEGELLGRRVRNLLRVHHAAQGLNFTFGHWGKYTGDRENGAMYVTLHHREYDAIWLQQERLSAPPVAEEARLLEAWASPKMDLSAVAAGSDKRILLLDEETRRASFDTHILPSSLLLLQALLSTPPIRSSKHGLMMLNRQWRKLSAEINPRDEERMLLERVEANTGTGGSNMAKKKLGSNGADAVTQLTKLTSARELFAGMGHKECEIIECVEEIQESLRKRTRQKTHHTTVKVATSDTKDNVEDNAPRIRSNAGRPPTEHEGRTAFVLAFGRAIPLKVKVNVDGQTTESISVSVLFCGTPASPLLVQRTNHAAVEEMEGVGVAGSSGAAAAAPRLGYVLGSGPIEGMDDETRTQAKADQKVYRAAVKAAAVAWKDGMTVSLPIPPRGLQWNLEAAVGYEEVAERSCYITATLEDEENGSWSFTISGKVVAPLDARNVLSSCCLPSTIKPLAVTTDPVSMRLASLLRRAFYAQSKPTDAVNDNFEADGGKVLMVQLGLSNRLELFEQLHSIAIDARHCGVDEGSVWGGWEELAASGVIHSGVWRDVLLKITTRDLDHVTIGPIGADGSGTGNDLSEGTVLRLMYAMEALYPSVLVREGALRWRVVPRGACYHHLLKSLEKLGRAEIVVAPTALTASETKTLPSELQPMLQAEFQFKQPPKLQPKIPEKLPPNPVIVKDKQNGAAASSVVGRPRRSCAVSASQAVAAIAASEATAGVDGNDDSEFAAPRGGKQGGKHLSAVAGINLSTEYLPLPAITSSLWEHQQRSVDSVLAGVRDGKLGFADASAVGAGKTLTALATVVGVAKHLQESGIARTGTLIMLPQEALLREWLLELAKHTFGFHIVEQRSDGTLFSLTYGNAGSPIDGNTIVISTLDRVAKAPFVRQAAWDFVVIDECLAVQNAAAKRCPSAWRQIEVSRCGCLLLSATFFRSKFHNLFYMVRMLRSPLPRTIEYLPALVHEHIVCEVPITNREWAMEPGHLKLPSGKLVYSSEGSVQLKDYSTYKRRISQWERDCLNRGDPSGFKLHADLKHLLRGELWEGAKGTTQTSPLAEAIAMQVQRLLKEGRRPVVFANTEEEKGRFRSALRRRGLTTLAWAEVTAKTRAEGFDVILATIGSESSGVNMQFDADCIVCRPTPGDVLEQMKGRVDRPGQVQNELKLVVVFAQGTIEEAEFANIRLAGSFFRTYLAPKATRYKEALLQVDIAAIVAIHGGNKNGVQKPKAGAVHSAWHSALENLTNANALQGHGRAGKSTAVEVDEEENSAKRPVAEEYDPTSKGSHGGNDKRGVSGKRAKGNANASTNDNYDEEEMNVEPELKTLNKTKRNRRSNEQYALAKAAAREGRASLAVRRWLFKTDNIKEERLTPPEKDKLWEFSTAIPPKKLTRQSVETGVRQLCKDPKLERIITRVGVDSIYMQVETFASKPATKARLFDYLLHGITFCQISIDAGNAFLRKLAIKAGSLIEVMPKAQRHAVLKTIATEMAQCGEYEEGMAPTATELINGKGGGLLLEANLGRLMFPPALIGVIVDACDKWGLPHLCATDDDSYTKVGCGKNEGTEGYLNACRSHLKGTGGKASVRYSLGALNRKGERTGKGRFIIELVKRARRPDGLPDVAMMSDRDVARRLMEIEGVGPWVASECLVYHLGRADIMVSGDLTMRNMLNDLYNIDHRESETLVESAATFPDCTRSRILLDRLARSNNWHGYRTLILFLSYFLQEDSLVLL